MRETREAKGWTQGQAADAAGIHRSTWVGAESGRRRVSAEFRAAIARVCEATPEAITVEPERSTN